MSDDGGISDNAIVGEVRHEPVGGGGGWTALGHALGGGLGGANTIAGENAYENGMRVGAQTADALAQARDRIQKSDSADQAAKALRTPELQQQLHLTPELGNYFATQAQMGRAPTEVTNMMLENQQYQLRGRIADTSQPLDARHAAAFAEAPASMAPKAEGPLGSVFDPGAAGGSGQTTVSPLQQRVAEAGVGLKDAQAAAAPVNAAAHTTTANAAAANSGNGGSKPPSGYVFKLDPNTHEKIMDQNGQPVLVPYTGGPADPSTPKEGAYSRIYHENMLGSAQGATTELKNLMDLGPQESVGLSNVKGSKGLLGAISTDMGRALSTTQQQMVHKSFANLGRYIATVENGGRPPAQGVTTPLQDTLESLPTDTQYARPYGLALARQDLEAQRTRVAGSSASPEIKKAFEDTLAELQKTVPFTPQDVRDWSRSGTSTTIGDWVKKKSAPGGGGAPPAGLTVVN